MSEKPSSFEDVFRIYENGAVEIHGTENGGVIATHITKISHLRLETNFVVITMDTGYEARVENKHGTKYSEEDVLGSYYHAINMARGE